MLVQLRGYEQVEKKATYVREPTFDLCWHQK